MLHKYFLILAKLPVCEVGHLACVREAQQRVVCASRAEELRKAMASEQEKCEIISKTYNGMKKYINMTSGGGLEASLESDE